MSGLLQRLKEDTRSLHQQVEQQAAIVTGAREMFTAVLRWVAPGEPRAVAVGI